ncbi:hypothetical protein JT06_18790 [Desulfobulbus sp. Tol-SR]|nr:hypothetical protein JT06_18790 [Desulfobulbus sp. Tol-SR]
MLIDRRSQMKYKQTFKCGHCGKDNELALNLIVQPEEKSTSVAFTITGDAKTPSYFDYRKQICAKGFGNEADIWLDI